MLVQVLIKAQADNILPEWMRFFKGVIDSEDLPLNISRENLQDSALIERVGKTVTRWVLGQLAREAKKDTAKYAAPTPFLRLALCQQPRLTQLACNQ